MTPSPQSIRPDSRTPKRSTVSVVLVAIVAAAVAIVSFLPAEDKQVLHSRGRFHSWGHLIAFSVVGYVAARAANSRQARIFAFCAAVIFGFAIEFGEHFAFHGPLERKDILVDAFGVIAGTLLASVSASRQ